MTEIVTLPCEIYCKEEVLGATFKSKIDGISVGVSFPRMDYSWKESTNAITDPIPPLLPPICADRIKCGNEELNWSYPRTYPSIPNPARAKRIDSRIDYKLILPLVYNAQSPLNEYHLI